MCARVDMRVKVYMVGVGKGVWEVAHACLRRKVSKDMRGVARKE